MWLRDLQKSEYFFSPRNFFWGEDDITLPETNELPLKMDGLNTTFLLAIAYFQGLLLLVSGRVVVIFCRWLAMTDRPTSQLESVLSKRSMVFVESAAEW